MPNGRKVSKYKTELGVTYEIMPDGSRRKLSKEEAAAVKPRRPINPSIKKQNEIYLKQQAEEQNMSDYPATMQGTDPVSASMRNMYDAEQNRKARKERFKNIIQTGDNFSDAVSKTTKNISQGFENFKTGFIQKKNNFTNNFKKD